MKKILSISILFVVFFSAGISQPGRIKNIWQKPPVNIPSSFSVDAPLMGNGDLTMSLGYVPNRLRFYLSKNDFWRLESQADNLSGPRIAGFVDINLNQFPNNNFSASQNLSNGVTTCTLSKNRLKVKSWVSATENLIFIELEAGADPVDVSINLTGPYNHQAVLKTVKEKNFSWLTRSFVENAGIPTEVAVALRIIDKDADSFILKAKEQILVTVAVESRFKTDNPLQTVIYKCASINDSLKVTLEQKHEQWWSDYWNKSSITVDDTVLMKAYYQGLYTMAACSRDINFPPGLFGWNTSDEPGWNGDYHLNYNHFAPFYSLYGANRIEQGITQDAPLLDFIPRGEWYAQNVTKTRGILYPVGIGPKGIEVTRNFPNESWVISGNIEAGGLFWQQRSNAAYGLVNMAQCWRLTYDKTYGQKIYPYVIGVVNFWEDYLTFENGRYVIYNEAIHEGSGKNKNPILSLGIIRNAFELAIDLSNELSVDRKRQTKWKDILSNLSAFPTQERNGKKVFRYTEEGVPWWNDNGLGIQHIYPANAITLNSDKELLMVARNTIADMKRWQDLNTSNSFFVAAVRVGYDPTEILKELHDYALHTYPNGFQLNNPHGIENACTVVNALTEMLCMSAGNVIRLFTGIPGNRKVRFDNIRTWGAFLVSAQLENGVISNVKIVSEKGRKCTVINPWGNKKVILFRNGKKAETLTGNTLDFKTSTGETIEIKSM
jgi:alpha-L-fucosidase 2